MRFSTRRAVGLGVAARAGRRCGCRSPTCVLTGAEPERDQAPVRVDVGREHAGHRRQVFLRAADEGEELRRRVAVLSEKMFAPVFVSTTDWWICIAEPGSRDIGFAMNVAYMSWRSAASRIVRLNRKTWSASVERVAVAQVDLHLRRAFLVDQRVDLEVLRFREVVDVVEEVVELVDRRDRIGLARRLRPPRAAGRRLERIVGIGVRLDQIELDLRRDHRPPAAVRDRARRCA